MPSKYRVHDWPLVPLGSIGRIVGGGTPTTKDPRNFGDDYPWITPKDLSKLKQRYVASGERGLSERGLRLSSARLLPPGTVIMSTRAPIGLIAVARVPVTTNQGCRSFIPSDQADPLFFYYLLGSMVEELERHANGSTFMEISASSLAAIEVPLPPLSEQRAIAEVLGALDDKIEANRRVVECLRAFSYARYIQVVSEGSLELQVSDVAEFHNKRRIPLSSRERAVRHGPYPYYGAAGQIDSVDDFLFDGTYLLVGEDGTVMNGDRQPMIQYVWGRFWVNNHAHVLTGKGITTELLRMCLISSDISAAVTGAVQPKLSMGNLKRVSIMIPNDRDQLDRELVVLADAERAKIRETQVAEQVRDTLLPKLLSGELRVRDAERLVEDAV